MNFDVFEDIKVPNKNILLEKCKAAEKNALIDPFSTLWLGNLYGKPC